MVVSAQLHSVATLHLGKEPLSTNWKGDRVGGPRPMHLPLLECHPQMPSNFTGLYVTTLRYIYIFFFFCKRDIQIVITKTTFSDLYVGKEQYYLNQFQASKG
jgi:hypothetical protein